MKKYILILLVILLTYCVNVFGATGNYWGRYSGDSTYTTQLICLYPDGTADTTSWDNISEVDTLIAMGSATVGMHYFQWRFLTVDDSLWHTPVDYINNISSGSQTATGYLSVIFETDLCDSIMHIHEFNGAFDTTIYTDVYGIDTSTACSLLSVGLHNDVVLFHFDGEIRWRSANSVFHNTFQVGIGSSSPERCEVYIDVEDITGDGNIRGIRFSGSLIRSAFSIIQDTCADKYITQLSDRDETDATGHAMIELIRSKCLKNGGVYYFEIYNPWTGERTYVKDSIPDSTSWRLPVSGW